MAAPVLDLLIDGDPIIGDRSFGTTLAEVIPLATAFIDGLQRCGITAVVKHIPGWVALIKIAMTLPSISTRFGTREFDWATFRLVTGTIGQ